MESTAPYALSLHDALPIFSVTCEWPGEIFLPRLQVFGRRVLDQHFPRSTRLRYARARPTSHLTCIASSQRMAARNNSVSEVTPNFSFARAQYACTVFKLRPKSSAICDDVRPWPSNRKISNSRSLKRWTGVAAEALRELMRRAIKLTTRSLT